MRIAFYCALAGFCLEYLFQEAGHPHISAYARIVGWGAVICWLGEAIRRF